MDEFNREREIAKLLISKEAISKEKVEIKAANSMVHWI